MIVRMGKIASGAGLSTSLFNQFRGPALKVIKLIIVIWGFVEKKDLVIRKAEVETIKGEQFM